MNDSVFVQVKEEYNNFYRELLKNGRLPMRSTEKGFWNSSVSDEIYEAFRKIGLDSFKSFLDIGSGDGKVVLIASMFCQNAEGIEIDKLLHDKALEIKNRLKISNAVFHNKDFFQHDFSGYDALFLAPDAPMERGLEKKLLKEMRGKLIHYGSHFHPRFLEKQKDFFVNGTLVSVYSNGRP